MNQWSVAVEAGPSCRTREHGEIFLFVDFVLSEFGFRIDVAD